MKWYITARTDRTLLYFHSYDGDHVTWLNDMETAMSFDSHKSARKRVNEIWKYQNDLVIVLDENEAIITETMIL